MKKIFVLAAICFVVSFVSQNAQAQNRFGGALAFGSDNLDIGIAAVGEFKIIDKGAISPQLVFFFPDNVNVFELNGNFNYYFYDQDILEFYGLAGLNFSRISWDGPGRNYSDSNVGLNLGAGLNFDLGKKVVPYTEFRFTVGDYDPIVLQLGVKVNLN